MKTNPAEVVRVNILYKRMKVAEARYQLLREAIVRVLDDTEADDHATLREALDDAAKLSRSPAKEKRQIEHAADTKVGALQEQNAS